MITSQIDQAIGQLLLDIVLPIELSNRNDGQGHSFWRTVAEKKVFSKQLSFYKRQPFQIGTFVAVTRILGKRQQLWDYSSGLRGSWKQLEDALVDAGWWYDDGPEYITGIIFRQDASQRDNGPAIRIQIWQSGDQPVRPKADTIAVAGRQKSAKVPRKRPARSSRSKSKRKLR
mgnify:CR=1 FL=1